MHRAILVAWVCCASTAWSAPSDASRAAFAEGQALYTASQYLEAATKFEAAYALDPDPAYLFNIAQAYRLGGECTKAVEYYTKFLVEVPSPPEVDTLRHFLNEANKCAIDEAREQRRRDQGQVQVAPAVVSTTTVDRGGTKRKLGIASIAVGVVALGTGAYFTQRALSLKKHREGLCAEGCTWSEVKADADSDDARGHNANIGSAVSYAVGGAAILGGVALYMLGRNSFEQVTVSPISGGAVVTGRLEF